MVAGKKKLTYIIFFPLKNQLLSNKLLRQLCLIRLKLFSKKYFRICGCLGQLKMLLNQLFLVALENNCTYGRNYFLLYPKLINWTTPSPINVSSLQSPTIGHRPPPSTAGCGSHNGDFVTELRFKFQNYNTMVRFLLFVIALITIIFAWFRHSTCILLLVLFFVSSP